MVWKVQIYLSFSYLDIFTKFAEFYKAIIVKKNHSLWQITKNCASEEKTPLKNYDTFWVFFFSLNSVNLLKDSDRKNSTKLWRR